jgi:hypothetical protein
MNKLQRLYEAGVEFELNAFSYCERPYVIWCVSKSGFTFDGGEEQTLERAIDAIWAAAREAYPDAECFKDSE